MELRRFWVLSEDLLEKRPSARELRRGGFCGGSGAVTFILDSVSPLSPSCSSMLTNDGMEALAQSLRIRYLPLSMMLIVWIGSLYSIFGSVHFFDIGGWLYVAYRYRYR